MKDTNYPSHHLGHRGRLRERFIRTQTTGLQDYEILELLLTFSITRRDVKPIAKELISRFGGLAAVLDASASELEETSDIGPRSSTLIKLVKEVCGVYLARRMEKRDLLTSPERVVSFATAKLAGLPHEAFMVIYLNTQNEVIEHAVLNEGTVDQVAVYPRRIVEKALALHASALVVVHNHPSGYTQPSEEDKRLTRSLKDSARLFDIRLLDHIIVGKSGHFSFLANGLV